MSSQRKEEIYLHLEQLKKQMVLREAELAELKKKKNAGTDEKLVCSEHISQ